MVSGNVCRREAHGGLGAAVSWVSARTPLHSSGAERGWLGLPPPPTCCKMHAHPVHVGPQEGKRSVCGEPTIFYMPHCGTALYNNLLWRNWSVDALSKVVIIGNSFGGLEER